MRKIILITIALMMIAGSAYAGCCLPGCNQTNAKGECLVDEYDPRDCKDIPMCECWAYIYRGSGLVIATSKEPVEFKFDKIDFKLPTGFECKNGPWALSNFYDHGWRLIQVLKTDKGYLYYLDKK